MVLDNELNEQCLLTMIAESVVKEVEFEGWV
jgi:hypothetical protein